MLPQFLQSVLGHDALGTGVRLIPLMAGLIQAAGSPRRLDRALGTRVAVSGGLALLAGSLVWLASVTAATPYAVIAAALALCGAGVGGAMAPAMDAVLAELPDGEAGTGAAINNTLRQVGGALGVAALGSLLSGVYGSALAPSLDACPRIRPTPRATRSPAPPPCPGSTTPPRTRSPAAWRACCSPARRSPRSPRSAAPADLQPAAAA